MKKHIMSLFWLILAGASTYFAYTYSNNVELKKCAELLIFVFIAGASISALIFNILFSNTETSLNMYKRELEKESIDKTESSSRIKVLESKIQVLEKALDEALKK